MGRPKSITIYWSKPVLWEERNDSSGIDNGPGVYAISRVFGGKETPLYIGETKRTTFSKRMDEHVIAHEVGKEDFLFKRGTKYVRFGHIDNIDKYEDLEMKRILRNTETHLIWKYGPICNRKQKKTSTIWKQLDISNRGSVWIFKRTVCRNTDDCE